MRTTSIVIWDVLFCTLYLEMAPKGNVRQRFIHFGATVVLTLCIWGQVSEIFDHWDSTSQTGNDIEYSTVIVALMAGAVLGLAHVAVTAHRTVSATCPLCLSVACLPSAPGSAVSIDHSPPPQPLRI